MMRVVEISGPRRADVVERPIPVAARDVVKIQVLVTPMCTEVRQFRDGGHNDVLGHEAAGIVVDAAGSTHLHEGDRVVAMPLWGCGNCRHCVAGNHIYCRNPRDVARELGQTSGMASYGQYLLKPEHLVLKVPNDIELRHAAMACCALGPTFTAMRRMRVTADNTVLVSGCGPVGMGGIVNAKARGARVIVLEMHPYRSQLALRLGADAVIDPRSPDAVDKVRALTGGEGADAAVDTSNAPSAPLLLQDMVRVLGRMAFVSWSGELAVSKIVGSGLEVHGCWHWNHQQYATEMFNVVRRSRRLLDLMTTHTFPLDEVQDAFALQETGECGKVLLFPHPDEYAGVEDVDASVEGHEIKEEVGA